MGRCRRSRGASRLGVPPAVCKPQGLPCIPLCMQLGPLERRIGLPYEEALFLDDVDPEATDYWFTEPAGERAWAASAGWLAGLCWLGLSRAHGAPAAAPAPRSPRALHPTLPTPRPGTAGWNTEKRRLRKLEELPDPEEDNFAHYGEEASLGRA